MVPAGQAIFWGAGKEGGGLVGCLWIILRAGGDEGGCGGKLVTVFISLYRK